jgi:membrane protein DedA with SNARE-associated domain
MEWFAMYGLPVYFVILAASSFGVPMPVKLLMLVVGASVQQGDMEFWQALTIGSLGAIAGDQAGYFLGRYGGRAGIEKITDRFGGAATVAKAESFSDKWGVLAVFFSRWLVTPLGPWINLLSGATNYSWFRFTAAGALGETLWIFLYVLLGMYFSDRVLEIAQLLTDLSWVIFGLVVAGILGWKIWQFFNSENSPDAMAADSFPRSQIPAKKP